MPVLPNLQMRWRLALVALYLAVILPLLLVNNVGLTPDSLVFIFFGAALLIVTAALFLIAGIWWATRNAPQQATPQPAPVASASAAH